MSRIGFIALCVAALPAAAAEPTGPPPDPAFLEFLAELPDEEESFVDFLESANGEQELKRAEKAAAKDVTDE
jgi:hypothetical protein